MDATETLQQIVDTKAILAKLSAAILALADPTVESYTLDDGQTRQTATRGTLKSLLSTRRELQNELCTLEARVTGNGVTRGQPAW